MVCDYAEPQNMGTTYGFLNVSGDAWEPTKQPHAQEHNEMKWNEMRWNDMRWNEMKSEAAQL